VIIVVLDSMNFESVVLDEELARQVKNSKVFQSTVVYAIVLCSIILGIETNYPIEHPFFHAIDFIFAFSSYLKSFFEWSLLGVQSVFSNGK